MIKNTLYLGLPTARSTKHRPFCIPSFPRSSMEAFWLEPTCQVSSKKKCVEPHFDIQHIFYSRWNGHKKWRYNDLNSITEWLSVIIYLYTTRQLARVQRSRRQIFSEMNMGVTVIGHEDWVSTHCSLLLSLAHCGRRVQATKWRVLKRRTVIRSLYADHAVFLLPVFYSVCFI